MVLFQNGKLAWENIDIPKVIDITGTLGVIEFGEQIDFEVKRVFFLRNISKESTRGFHSHKSLKQLIICLNGTLSLMLDSGIEVETISMSPDSPAVYVDGRVWREMHNFSDDAVLLVLCDREYRFDEVIREYDKFKKELEGLV
jgi:dTDP-4-dehydrorhamnose 3,5-epimerase-like enzyme